MANYRRKFNVFVAFVVALLLTSAVTAAGVEDHLQFAIEKQPLAKALLEYSRLTNKDVVTSSELLDGKIAPALNGRYSPEEGLRLLLANSGLEFTFQNEKVVLVTGRLESAGTDAEKTVKPKKEINKGFSGKHMLEEMVVTAQKREQNLIDVPISISAIGAKELEARQVDDMGDLAMIVPGLSVSQAGHYKRFVYVRGVGNESGTSSSVGIYVDEMPVTGNANRQMDLRINDLERIEVLRGPQGTLYGEGAMGGTIRLITATPQLNRFTAKANLSTFATRGGAPSQQIQTVFNTPIIEDELGLKVSGTFLHDGGWIDQPLAFQADINSEDLVNIRIKSVWQPADRLQVNTMAIIHRNNASQSSGEDEHGNFTAAFDQPIRPSIEDDYNIYNVTVTYDFDTFRLTNSVGYQDTDKHIRFATEIFPIAEPPVPPFYFYYPVRDSKNEIVTEEVRFNSVGPSAWQWTAGGFYRHAQLDQFLTSVWDFIGSPMPPLSSVVSITRNESSQSLAVFGDASYALSDRLELGAGARYYKDDRQFFNGAATSEDTFNSFNPRIYASYKVFDNINVYASAAKGFRSGGQNNLNQPSYNPETIWTYELGTKMMLLNGSLDMEVALFYSDYSNYQIVGILPPPAIPDGIITNAGNVEIRGVDVSSTWRATDKLTLMFNGNYVHTEFKEILATSTSHIVGDPLDDIPAYSFTASTNYDFNWAGRPGSFLLDYNFRDRSTYRNRTFGSAHISQSGIIGLLNLKVSWQWSDNLSFGVFVQNIFNDRDFVDPNSVLGMAARARPRTVGIEFGMQFE